MAPTTNQGNGVDAVGRNGQLDPRKLTYENSNLDEITVRQLSEDILAYNHDLDFCQDQLAQANLTPQETRTLQLRILDLGHQIRHCQHRSETLRVQMCLTNRIGTTARVNPSSTPRGSHKRQAVTGTPGEDITTSAPSKRARLQQSPAEQNGDSDIDTSPGACDGNDVVEVDNDDDDDHSDGSPSGPITTLQRLGHWRCRLCRSDKYLLSGSGRVSAAPCKWPLKDVAKMIAHFTEMHAEHLPSERCAELGAALRRNRGPFEYWLRRSRSQNVGEGGRVVDGCIHDLLRGRLPDLLRRLSRAAAGFPSG